MKEFPFICARGSMNLPRFKAGALSLRAHEIADLGDVRDKDLVHLQCHFGKDTLSWARLGARVTGLDFSEPAVKAAVELAREIGVDARFVTADVYDATAALDGRRFDIVYTGVGALCWLPDMERWAKVVCDLLRPGGQLYLFEFHPLRWISGKRQRDPKSATPTSPRRKVARKAAA
jgi:SAM-dependent methyltransferase